MQQTLEIECGGGHKDRTYLEVPDRKYRLTYKIDAFQPLEIRQSTYLKALKMQNVTNRKFLVGKCVLAASK